MRKRLWPQEKFYKMRLIKTKVRRKVGRTNFLTDGHPPFLTSGEAYVMESAINPPDVCGVPISLKLNAERDRTDI